MKTFKSYLPTGFFILGLGLAGGLIYALLYARFSSGDAYPPYSSFRADPMGTRALFEALENSSWLSASRALQPFKSGRASPHTRIYAGLGLKRLADWHPEDIQAWLATGGQLVLSFDGQAPSSLPGYRKKAPATSEKKAEKTQPETTPGPEPSPASSDDDDPFTERSGDRQAPQPANDDSEDAGHRRPMTWEDVLHRFGCRAAVSEKYEGVSPAKALLEADMDLPPDLRWRSPLIFNPAAAHGSSEIDSGSSTEQRPSRHVHAEQRPARSPDGWISVYHTFCGSCVLEKKVGRGKIIVLGESYLLSNEAMGKDRHPDLLLWLIGDNRHIVFDETHFGVRKKAGVGVLLRRYRLQGVLIVLLLTGVLFVWRNSHSLVRVPTEDDISRTIRVNPDGYVTLIQRGVPPKQLPVEWCEAWDRSRPRQSADDKARIALAWKVAATYNPKHPMDVFEKITRILTDKKRK